MIRFQKLLSIINKHNNMIALIEGYCGDMAPTFFELNLKQSYSSTLEKF